MNTLEQAMFTTVAAFWVPPSFPPHPKLPLEAFANPKAPEGKFSTRRTFRFTSLHAHPVLGKEWDGVESVPTSRVVPRPYRGQFVVHARALCAFHILQKLCRIWTTAAVYWVK